MQKKRIKTVQKKHLEKKDYKKIGKLSGRHISKKKTDSTNKNSAKRKKISEVTKPVFKEKNIGKDIAQKKLKAQIKKYAAKRQNAKQEITKRPIRKRRIAKPAILRKKQALKKKRIIVKMRKLSPKLQNKPINASANIKNINIEKTERIKTNSIEKKEFAMNIKDKGLKSIKKSRNNKSGKNQPLEKIKGKMKRKNEIGKEEKSNNSGVKIIYDRSEPKEEIINHKKERKHDYSAAKTAETDLARKKELQVYSLGNRQKTVPETTKEEYLNDLEDDFKKNEDIVIYNMHENKKIHKSYEKIDKKESKIYSDDSKTYVLKSKPIVPNAKFLKINMPSVNGSSSADNNDPKKNAAYGRWQAFITKNSTKLPSQNIESKKNIYAKDKTGAGNEVNLPDEKIEFKEIGGKFIYTGIKGVKLEPDKEFINKLKWHVPSKDIFETDNSAIQKPANVQENRINQGENENNLIRSEDDVESNAAKRMDYLAREIDLLWSQINEQGDKTKPISLGCGFDRHDIIVREHEKRRLEIMSMLKHLDDTDREINAKRIRIRTIENELSKKEFEIVRQEAKVKEKRQMLEESLITHLIGTKSIGPEEKSSINNPYRDLLEEYLKKLRKLYSKKDIDSAKKIIEKIKSILDRNDFTMEFRHDYYQKVLEIMSDMKKK